MHCNLRTREGQRLGGLVGWPLHFTDKNTELRQAASRRGPDEGQVSREQLILQSRGGAQTAGRTQIQKLIVLYNVGFQKGKSCLYSEPRV